MWAYKLKKHLHNYEEGDILRNIGRKENDEFQVESMDNLH